jgi:SAM-dependent methyltransferase
MHYDPVKNIFAGVIRSFPLLRVGFYKTLDLMFLRSWYVRRELRQLRASFAGKEIAILDAGCGFGQYSYFMSKHLAPCDILAVDVKEDWIADCKQFFASRGLQHVAFEIADLTKIAYQEKFDLIVCVDVMEHIHEDVEVFANFSKALKPGGFVIINSPSIYGGSDVHDEHEESFVGEHARTGYSHEELDEKLGSQGFQRYQYKYTYGFWGDKAWRLGIKYPMLLLNVSKAFIVLLPFYYLITFLLTYIMMQIDYRTTNTTGSGINYIAQKKTTFK